ncbi:MAG TPA: stage II sporulation protein R [Firmicutes bacterium]|nr:stage II sporulation protein R [Candidatus Fermentithermobacillaceae bacterium]
MRRRRRSEVAQAFLLTVVAGALLFAGWGFAEARKTTKAYTPNNLSKLQTESVPAGIVRLHVIGNSDSETDQEVKLKVRDAIMDAFGGKIAAADDAIEAETVIVDSLSLIEEVAVQCLSQNGMDYGAKAALKTVYFPDRTYRTASGQEVFLPEGDYRALQVVLGKGQGQNWWCVMYPPLCYFDLVQRTVADSRAQKLVVPVGTAEGPILVDELSTEDVPVELRCFIVDALRSGFQRLTQALRAQLSAVFCETPQNMP